MDLDKEDDLGRIENSWAQIRLVVLHLAIAQYLQLMF